MASGLYTAGVAALMGGAIDLENDTISALLIDSSEYTVDLDNDATQDDIATAAQIAEETLAGKTIDGTTFRASDVTFQNVTGDNVDAVVIFLDTTEADTSTLLAYIDNASEFPITPDGTNITIQWDTGANGIFKL